MAGFANKEELESVVARFIEGMTKSEALAKLCQGVNVSITYRIRGFEAIFHTGFANGVVTGGIGEPATPSTLRLEMDGGTFDGIMSGRTSGEAAAMFGGLSFSGDMMGAMRLQRLQPELIRLYKEVRAQGNPA